jgi:molybdate transport system substrate-binding protein
MKRVVLILLAAALLSAPGGGAGSTARITVYAASSLTEVFPRVDGRPRYSFGGSNQLAFQIEQGAPVDVFASASPKHTQQLYRGGLVERPRAFAANALVLAVPRSNPAGLRSVFDLRYKQVRLVVGTASVPVGDYTRQLLRRLGLTSVLGKVVSQESDVKSIVGKLALGEADAGFVYATDAKAVASRVTVVRLPRRSQPTVRYEVAVVEGSDQEAAAQSFVADLLESRGRRTLAAAGFGLP